MSQLVNACNQDLNEIYSSMTMSKRGPSEVEISDGLGRHHKSAGRIDILKIDAMSMLKSTNK